MLTKRDVLGSLGADGTGLFRLFAHLFSPPSTDAARFVIIMLPKYLMNLKYNIYFSVLLRLELKRTLDSSLNSIRSLLYHHYLAIDSQQAKFPRKKDSQREESVHDNNQEDMETDNSTDIAPDEEEREGGEEKTDESAAATVLVTVHQAAAQTLDYLKPFLEKLHSEYTSKVH